MHYFNQVKLSFLFCLLAMASTAVAAPQATKPAKPVAKTEASPKPNAAANTPEAVLRRFLVALMSQDGKTLRATIVPVSDADFVYLMGGEAPPGGDRMKAEFEKMPIKTLKPGDMVALPGGRTVLFPAKGIGADKALLQPSHFPVPFLLQRIGGQWKVNAAPLIGARKSAAGVAVPPPAAMRSAPN